MGWIHLQPYQARAYRILYHLSQIKTYGANIIDIIIYVVDVCEQQKPNYHRCVQSTHVHIHTRLPKCKKQYLCCFLFGFLSLARFQSKMSMTKLVCLDFYTFK